MEVLHVGGRVGSEWGRCRGGVSVYSREVSGRCRARGGVGEGVREVAGAGDVQRGGVGEVSGK